MKIVSDTNENRENNEYILQALSPDYVSIYRIELNTGKYEILSLLSNTNAKALVDEGAVYPDFDEYTQAYCRKFIREEEQDEFLDWFCCRNMKKRLQKDEKITYHYRSVSKDGSQLFYEAYAVKGHADEKEFTVFLAFRNVDSILYKEKAIQERLQKALDESELRNEIISSIAKVYNYLSRIDIREDYYEEIANESENPIPIKRAGSVTVGNEEACRDLVAREYQEAFFDFTNIKTLPERMESEPFIELEYRMRSGDWHKMCFIEKKRDENGELTHVLCAIRTITDAKKREQELLYQMAEAKRDAAIKTHFLSNMSHDIRTPINGIMGMVELANQFPDDKELQQQCRDKTMASLQTLLSIVNDILDMNHLESGDAVPQDVAFDLTDVLNATNMDQQKKAALKDVEYVVDWDHYRIKHRDLEGNSAYLDVFCRLLVIMRSNLRSPAVTFMSPVRRSEPKRDVPGMSSAAGIPASA